MVIIQNKPKRNPSGSRTTSMRKKRIYEMGREPSMTKVDKTRFKHIRTKAAGLKFRLLSADTANVFDPKTKKFTKLKIKNVVENPANRHFVRRNIITKGCVVTTEQGKARVTSRPGQDGTVNAVLI